MNRRQKIIVSITGIFIILLALVGLTYAYFLTRITGNENDKSISVTTANLELLYGDGNNVISMSNIMPGDPIPVKTFSVTNNGNATVENYKVYLESVQNQLELKDDLKYTLTCKQFKTSDYELWEKSTDENKKITDLAEEGTCTGKERETFPSVMNLIGTNTINVGYTQYYELQLEYLYQDFDQSIDMGKKVQAKVNIYDEKTKSLATEILANVKSGKNGTTLLDEPVTPVAEEFSILKGSVATTEMKEYSFKDGYGWMSASYGATQEEADNANYAFDLNEIEPIYYSGIEICQAAKGQYLSAVNNDTSKKDSLGKILDCTEEGNPIIESYIDEYEKSMSTEQDDYGTSYYYRGAVQDNYLNFAGMCWRIVRIQGDGSIKLLLDDKNTTCNNDNFNRNWNIGIWNYGYDNSSGKKIANYLEPVTNANNSMVKAFYDFQETFTSEEKSKLKVGDWCLNDIAYTRSSTLPYKFTLIDENTDRYTLNEFYYDSYVRLSGENENGYEPTLKCNGTVMDKFKSVTYNGSEIIKQAPMYVGTLTADEMVFAGSKFLKDYSDMGYDNYYSYIIDKNSRCSDELGCMPGIYSLSLARILYKYDSVFTWLLPENIMIDSEELSTNEHVRPSVILIPNISIVKGDGTQMNPYVVE